MVGLIIAGHGNFGSGFHSSMKVIGGEIKNLVAIDFIESMSTNTLEALFESAVADLLTNNNGVIVFTDLVGGSPFKTAAVVSMKYQNVYVIGGCSLPMMLEINAARAFIEEGEDLVNLAISTGKDQIMKFDLAELKVTQEPDGDGI